MCVCVLDFRFYCVPTWVQLGSDTEHAAVPFKNHHGSCWVLTSVVTCVRMWVPTWVMLGPNTCSKMRLNMSRNMGHYGS